MTSPVLIFGLGYHGRAAYRVCLSLPEKYAVIGFLDNNLWKRDTTPFYAQRSFRSNIPVYPPSDTSNLDFEKIIVGGPSRHTMRKQLLSLGVGDAQIEFWGASTLRAPADLIKARSVKTNTLLLKLCDALETQNLTYWLDFSGLLALTRNQLLGELSDVDVSLLDYDMGSAASLIKQIFADCDLEYCHFPLDSAHRPDATLHHIAITEQCDSLHREPAALDVMIKFVNNDTAISTLGFSDISVPGFHFQGNSLLEFEDRQIPVPVRWRDYLRQIYGKNWYHPTEYFDRTA